MPRSRPILNSTSVLIFGRILAQLSGNLPSSGFRVMRAFPRGRAQLQRQLGKIRKKNGPTVTRHLHTISRLTRDLGTSHSHHERQGPESGPLLAARGLKNAPVVALAERGPRELHEEQLRRVRRLRL